MKKLLLTILLVFLLSQNCLAESNISRIKLFKNTRAVKSVLNSQIKFANRLNFDKFISTYDVNYKNGDGYNLDVYSKLVKELWNNYNNIKYGIKIKDIVFDDENTAKVSLVETSSADIPMTETISGVLYSEANSIYYLKKINGKWRVYSDKVLDEDTSIFYGDAVNLDVKLTAPNTVTPGYEYTVSLEFTPPQNTFVIASIAKNKITYPQKQAKEVFRKLPEDNILERLFVANSDNANEYVIASIGITKADIKDMNIQLSLTGFGYKIIRVNVADKIADGEADDVKNE